MRSVWIAFVGRIVAQIIGAAASVVLGLFILQRYQSAPAPAPAASADLGSRAAQGLAAKLIR